MKLIHVVYGVGFITAIIQGVTQIIAGAEFSNIFWPFASALWVIVAFVNILTIEIQEKIIKLIDSR